MRIKCYFGGLAMLFLVAGGCGREPLPEPLPDRAMVPTGAVQVERPVVDTPVPSVPVDAGVAAAADPVPAAVRPAAALPIFGPGGGVVVDQEGKVFDRLIEKPRVAGIEPEPAPPGVFPPGGP